MHLIEHLTEAVDRYWTVDVEIIGTSDDGPAASVMHRQTPAVRSRSGRSLRESVRGTAARTVALYHER